MEPTAGAPATFVALTTVTLAIWSGPASATIPLAPIEGTKYPEWIAGTRHDDTIRARGGGRPDKRDAVTDCERIVVNVGRD